MVSTASRSSPTAAREAVSPATDGRWWGLRGTEAEESAGLSDRTTHTPAHPPPPPSRFLVLDTSTLRTRRTIDLPGDFSFDALSPDTRTLYLIQHTAATDFERYRVRAYDLARGRLLPDAIVDRTEPNMRGIPVGRLVGPGAGWVYTLYSHQAGEPFVHALDTVHGQARCLDVEWHGNQDALWSAHLKLSDGQLAVLSKQGKPIAKLELQTAKESGFAVGWIGAIAAAVLAGTALVVWSRRARARRT
jgi:hypothetical protein